MLKSTAFAGEYCDCDETSLVENRLQCIAPSATKVCSDRGECICGSCLCDEGYKGQFCECSACDKVIVRFASILIHDASGLGNFSARKMFSILFDNEPFQCYGRIYGSRESSWCRLWMHLCVQHESVFLFPLPSILFDDINPLSDINVYVHSKEAIDVDYECIYRSRESSQCGLWTHLYNQHEFVFLSSLPSILFDKLFLHTYHFICCCLQFLETCG